MLIRWRVEKGLALNNLVYMTAEEFEQHIKVPTIEEHYPPELIERVDKLLEEVQIPKLALSKVNQLSGI